MTTRSCRYLVVGGGMTAAAACRGIRAHDADGTIGLVGDDPHPPYKRPPLTKGLWKNSEEGSIWCSFDQATVDVRLGRRIVGLDLAARRAADDRGDEYAYERVVLATGGRPRGDAVVYSAPLTITDACARVRTRVPVSSSSEALMVRNHRGAGRGRTSPWRLGRHGAGLSGRACGGRDG